MIIEYDDLRYIRLIKELAGDRYLVSPLARFLGLSRATVKCYLERIKGYRESSYREADDYQYRYEYKLVCQVMELYRNGIPVSRIASLLAIPFHRVIQIIDYMEKE